MPFFGNTRNKSLKKAWGDKRNIWPDFLEKISQKTPFEQGYMVEATSSTGAKTFLNKNFPEVLGELGHHLIRIKSKDYSVTVMPLRDYSGKIDTSLPDAGLVILWEDVSKQIATLAHNIKAIIFYGVLLFLLIELLLFYGLKLMTRSLQVELKQSIKMEAASNNARLIAEESSKLKTDFLSNISHELHTPMNTIVGLGHMLGNEALSLKQQGFVANINHASNKLLNLIDEILLVSRLDATADQEILTEIFDPKQLLVNVKNALAETASDKGITVRVEIPAKLPASLIGLPELFEQVLRQLLGNAIKFGGGNDVVISIKEKLRTSKEITLEFAVTDTGIGITEEQLKLIFHPFQQVDRAKTRRYDGTGLGLTIAQKLLQQAGSTLVAESAINQGSHFFFEFNFDTCTAQEGIKGDGAADNVAVERLSLPAGTMLELKQLLEQLVVPLESLKPKPCQEIAAILKAKQWPEALVEDVDSLIRLIRQYRFTDAQEILVKIKSRL